MGHENPIECIKRLIELFRAKEFATLEFLKCTLHLASWLVEWIDENRDDSDDLRVYSGADPELVSECCDLYEELEGSPPPIEGPAGGIIFHLLLGALINRLIKALEDSEIVDDLIAKLVELLEQFKREHLK